MCLALGLITGMEYLRGRNFDRVREISGQCKEHNLNTSGIAPVRLSVKSSPVFRVNVSPTVQQFLP